ncbi:MAG: efflux RND transporter periplasmic adaptor subunit [Alphaproteobacteria bacterium]|jgi:multidrug efflux system membrane fusion protein|tara:strand:+ start:1024 stop:2268 length:1245 start_codon:yes stop_codon:yes gene_type:complete
MKRSIIVAFLILAGVVGWLGSGQITNVNAQDEANSNTTENKDTNSYKSDDNSNENEELVFSVETKVFKANLIDQSIELQGQTIHNKKIDVKSETSGNISEINFSRGDKVNKNLSLVLISMDDRKEKLLSAQKDLERLSKELILNEKNRDNLLRQNIEKIKLYEIEYASAKQLIDKGLSSKSKLSLASFNLANAEADREDIKIKFESTLANLEAQITNVKSLLKNIKLDIAKTNISAPFDGIISEKMVEETEFISVGTPLFTIIDLDPIKIEGYLSEFDVNKVSVGTNAIIEDSNGIKKNGTITFISPSAEISTRTFEITIEANNKDLTYKSGITTKIIIKGSELKAHKIPPSILTLLDDGTVGVKAVNKENNVVFYPTKTIKDTIDGMWVSGLPESVNLIISGQEYISIGEKIN